MTKPRTPFTSRSTTHAQCWRSDPEDTSQRLVTAADSEWLASLAGKQGKPAEAERLWRSSLEIRTELAGSKPTTCRRKQHSPSRWRIQAVATRP